MSVLARIAAFLSVFSASITAAVVFQNVDRASDEPVERSPYSSEGISRGRICELASYTDVHTRAAQAEVRILSAGGEHLARVQTDRRGVFPLPRSEKAFSLLLSNARGGAVLGVKVPPPSRWSSDHQYAADAILLPPADWAVALRYAAAAGDERPGGRSLTDREIEESAPLAIESVLPFRPEGHVEARLVVLAREGVRAAPGMTVHFYREGRPVTAAVRTDADGVFTVSGLSRGYYALIGYGPSGFAAFAVHVGGPAEAHPGRFESDLSGESTDDVRNGLNSNGGDDRAAAPSRPPARATLNPPIAVVVRGSLVSEFAFAGRRAEHALGLPAPQGGAGGGGSSAGLGNGFYRGGGSLESASGLGAFLGTGGLIAGSAALADENDHRHPVSPSR